MLKLVERKARFHRKYRNEQAAAHYIAGMISTQTRLARNGHAAIRVCKTRAVIDAPFKHARIHEAIVTLRYGDPIIIALEQLDELTRTKAIKKSTDYFFQLLKNNARGYAKYRPPTRHTKWKD